VDIPSSGMGHAGSSSALDLAYGGEADGSIFLKEQYFHHLLSLEKKRTERSGNPSLLMLIDISDLSANTKWVETISKISRLLCDILRETDIKGWYKSNSIIGVVVSEIGDSNPIEASKMILAKFTKSLSKEIDPDVAAAIRTDFESITKKKKWKNGNSWLKLPTYDPEPIPGKVNGFAFLAKSLLGGPLFLGLIDLLLITAAQLAGFRVRLGATNGIFAAHVGAYCSLTIWYFVSLHIFDLYNMERVLRTKEIILRITFSVILALMAAAICSYLVPQWEYGRGVLAIQAVAAWIMLTAWRLIYRNIFKFSKSKVPTIIIGTGEKGESALQLLRSPHSQFSVVGFLDDDPSRHGGSENGSRPVLGTTDKLCDVVHERGVKAVVLAMEGNGSARIARSILEARLSGREVFDLPSLCEKIAGRIPVRHVEDQWFVYADGFHLISKEYVQKIKRIFDFVCAAIMLFLSLPILALTALAIRIDSTGPVFYRQIRIGIGGKPFTLYKFRSMYFNAEQQGAKWAQKRDPRVTRVGKWLRIFRIDELPQIWNVFTGDMSLIGPRPERPEFVEELDKHIPYYCVRHTIRPGITGWAQIKYPYGASVEDALRKLEYDLYYIKNMSILQDLQILLKTVGVIMMGEGAR